MYSTPIDVRAALAPGGEGTGTAADMSDALLVQQIEEADARIDAYVPSGYTIPMATVNQGDPAAPVQVAHPLFRFLSRDIAGYLATLTWKKNKDVSEDDPVRLRYVEALTILNFIRTGELVLPEDPDNPYTEGNPEIYNQYTGTLFGLEDFDLAVLPRGLNLYYLRAHDMVR